ncbi:hypothetical protein AC578_7749 [Pseudocercospora eumusae]|uniref:Uncharacterized protein n=1 Tax=Pseudocercospora eumusae TaxID=321146 RepID=A0A139HL03_9PEZI|nr:hypothetical protein AC578_7749 [Pseudocercospora eumusae]
MARIEATNKTLHNIADLEEMVQLYITANGTAYRHPSMANKSPAGFDRNQDGSHPGPVKNTFLEVVTKNREALARAMNPSARTPDPTPPPAPKHPRPSSQP